MQKEVGTIEYPPPVELKLANRRSMENYGIHDARWTPPGAKDGHYLALYLWDSCYSTMVFADHSYIKEATEEVDSILATQNQWTGFFPNMTRVVPRPAYKEMEWLFFRDKKHSEYTQPPMMAQAVKSVYDAHVKAGTGKEGLEFLKKRYGALKIGYDYFKNFRQNSQSNPLINNIHPNETGLDSYPANDFIRPRFPRNGIATSPVIDLINPGLDLVGSMMLNLRNYRVGWDIQSIRKHFNLTSVMFNAKYHENLTVMADIAEILGLEEDMLDFESRAYAVEQAILDRMWDPRARNGQGSFFDMNHKGHIQETGISNLYPLLLPNLLPAQLISCLDLMDSVFSTEYPLPTVATDSRNYDPHYQEKQVMWRGGVWQWPNYDITRGLVRQASRQDIPAQVSRRCLDWAKRIAESSAKLVAGSPHEFHNPITGEGYRTPNFAGAGEGWPTRDSSLVDRKLVDRVLGIKLNLL